MMEGNSQERVRRRGERGREEKRETGMVLPAVTEMVPS